MDILSKEQYQHFLLNLISNKGAHANAFNALVGITPEIAGKQLEGYPNTIWQLIKHINYWQNFVVESLEGNGPKMPQKAQESWAFETAPANQDALDLEYAIFMDSVAKAKQLAMELEGFEEWEHLRIMAAHISYHIGQIVLLRQVFGNWDSETLGLTW
ncbi:MAG: DinB family protein [Aureispira sp.]|nr:DinB family protein [Aureispira sp.]